MAGCTLVVRDLAPIRVVNMPSSRDDRPDSYHVQFGTYDAGGVEYPMAALYLSKEEASELANKLLEAIA
jgi:hypothetical protein